MKFILEDVTTRTITYFPEEHGILWKTAYDGQLQFYEKEVRIALGDEDSIALLLPNLVYDVEGPIITKTNEEGENTVSTTVRSSGSKPLGFAGKGAEITKSHPVLRGVGEKIANLEIPQDFLEHFVDMLETAFDIIEETASQYEEEREVYEIVYKNLGYFFDYYLDSNLANNFYNPTIANIVEDFKNRLEERIY